MSLHIHVFSRFMCPIVVFIWLASVGILHADQPKPENALSGRPLAEKRVENARNEKNWSVDQRIAGLEAELKGLAQRVGPNHPRVRQVVAQLRALRDAKDRDRKAQLGRARMQHAQQAIEQLHAADLHDLAEMIDDRIRDRLVDRERDDRLRSNRESRENGQDKVQEQGVGTHDDVRHVIDRLGQAVRNIEQRLRDSEEIQRAVEDTQRNLNLMQREFELRFREIEQAVKHRDRDAERSGGGRSDEVEEAIENIEEFVDRRIGELEERLDFLYEYFDDGDDESDLGGYGIRGRELDRHPDVDDEHEYAERRDDGR